MRARALALVAIGACLGSACVSDERVDASRRNVIVIVTDDQSYESVPRPVPVMPFLQARILDPADDWVVFPNAFVNTPLCCPSRATLLTGRYPHHTGVVDNEDGAALDEGSTIAAWLDAAGYHTGLVGKYLNGYPFGRGPFIPQGWDRWWGKQQGPATSVYRDYTLIVQGVPEDHGASEADYLTDVLADAAAGFIREAPPDEPFFLWFAPTAPHPEWVSAARHEGTFEDLPVPARPSLGEPDVSDKPAWVRALPPMGAEEREEMREARRDAYETLLAVDDAVREILGAVRDRGESQETVVVIVSDNGFAFGEHRWVRKGCPYDECVRVPLFIRVPGAGHRTEPSLVSAVDLAPTIAELTGATPGGGLDGVSLAPLLLEGSRDGLSGEVFMESVGDERIPAWRGLRTRLFAYVELATGERELYDLRRDPFQLVNVISDPGYATQVERLEGALDAYGDA